LTFSQSKILSAENNNQLKKSNLNPHIHILSATQTKPLLLIAALLDQYAYRQTEVI